MVIVTEWQQFCAVDFKRLKRIMARPVMVDLRNVYRSQEAAQHGFAYESVGRPGVAASSEKRERGDGKAY